MTWRRVCVFCASSDRLAPEYLDEAERVGELLARATETVVYGGGSVGSMGRLASGVLKTGGRIVGVLPEFMDQLEWGHTGLTELQIVKDMRTRKERMVADSDAVVALPGGSGTLEELMEVIAMKRLGLYVNPIVLVNTRRFFDRLIEFLEHCVLESMMDARHREMWSVVDNAEGLIAAIESAPQWSREARDFATLR